MPDTPTHDLITVATAVALVPIGYFGFTNAGFSPSQVAVQTGLLVGAHLLSGLMFSPDLDLNTRIDDRWGPFFWIWRPYMWVMPHRNFWSHGLIVPPILRLCYFYAFVCLALLGASWALAQFDIILPAYHQQLTNAIVGLGRAYPREALTFAFGFITGAAAHSIADWLVTGGKYVLLGLGIHLKHNYDHHDQYVPRQARRSYRRA